MIDPASLPDLTNQKIVSDCYEFLHLVELGRGSLRDLVTVFGSPENQYESNYRQVERIKRRCQKLGIHVVYDEQLTRFRTESGAKLKLLDLAENAKNAVKKDIKVKTFGPFKVSKVSWSN